MALAAVPEREAPRPWTTAQVTVALRFVPATPDPVAETSRPREDVLAPGAAMVGAHMVWFDGTLASDPRDDLLRALLLAHVVATKVIAPRTLDDVRRWFDSYFSVLSKTGFVARDEVTVTPEVGGDESGVRELIEQAVTVLPTGSPQARLFVERSLEMLQRIQNDPERAALFDRDSKSETTARVQLSLVDQGPGAHVRVTSIALGLKAARPFDNLLSARFQRNDLSLLFLWRTLVVDAEFLASVRESVARKVAAHSQEYLKHLPDL
jgi:hypothetical protein